MITTSPLPHQLLMVNASTVGLVPLDCFAMILMARSSGKETWGRSRLVQVLVRVVLLFCTRINLLLFVIVRGNLAYRS